MLYVLHRVMITYIAICIQKQTYNSYLDAFFR